MEESAPAKSSSLSVPAAIVIAGAFIALAVYFSRGGITPVTQNQANQNNPTPNAQVENALTIRPVNSADHTLGNPTAPVSLVVYTDTECPFCKIFHSTVTQVANTYGKNGSVLVVYRHFPLAQLHPRAPKEAEATECATAIQGKTAFWDFINEIFKVTPSNNGLDPAELPKIASRIGINGKDLTMFNECLSIGKFESRVNADYEEAVNAGGHGTPFSIFIIAKPLTDTNSKTIQELNDGFLRQGAQEPPFTISTDKKRIAMSGALPITYVERIVDMLLKN